MSHALLAPPVRHGPELTLIVYRRLRLELAHAGLVGRVVDEE